MTVIRNLNRVPEEIRKNKTEIWRLGLFFFPSSSNGFFIFFPTLFFCCSIALLRRFKLGLNIFSTVKNYVENTYRRVRQRARAPKTNRISRPSVQQQHTRFRCCSSSSSSVEREREPRQRAAIGFKCRLSTANLQLRLAPVCEPRESRGTCGGRERTGRRTGEVTKTEGERERSRKKNNFGERGAGHVIPGYSEKMGGAYHFSFEK